MNDGAHERATGGKEVANTLGFDPTKLTQVQVTLDGTQSELASLGSQMAGFQSDLTSASWLGNASKTFISSYAQFQDGYSMVLKALTKLQTDVGSAEKGLTGGEAEVQASAKKVASGIVSQINTSVGSA
jgi:uncharacterized protein YukE